MAGDSAGIAPHDTDQPSFDNDKHHTSRLNPSERWPQKYAGTTYHGTGNTRNSVDIADTTMPQYQFQGDNVGIDRQRLNRCRKSLVPTQSYW